MQFFERKQCALVAFQWENMYFFVVLLCFNTVHISFYTIFLENRSPKLLLPVCRVMLMLELATTFWNAFAELCSGNYATNECISKHRSFSFVLPFSTSFYDGTRVKNFLCAPDNGQCNKIYRFQSFTCTSLSVCVSHQIIIKLCRNLLP